MRILKLRGANLASLSDEFDIDFESLPLSRAGVFVISGPTGAGKSTLLDALCVALFDKTPRLSNRGGAVIGRKDDRDESQLTANDVRSLLRRGASWAYAEVEFLGIDGKPYKARWSVARARSRADGKIQAQKVELYNQATGVLLSDKKTEALDGISQKLGLTFEQFRRSVLLAQGDFAAFLKSDAKERAELLEKMTGTEIYARLSKAAFERAKRERESLQTIEAKLSALPSLDPPARRLLEQRQIESQASFDRLNERKRELSRSMSWFKTRAQLTTETNKARTEADGARLAREHEEPLRQQLEEIDSVEFLRTPVELLLRADSDLASARASEVEASQSVESAQVASRGAQAGVKAAEDRLATARQHEREAQSVLRKAREPDGCEPDLLEGHRTLHDAMAAFTAARRDFLQAQTTLEETEKQSKDADATQARAEMKEMLARQARIARLSDLARQMATHASDARSAESEKSTIEKRAADAMIDAGAAIELLARLSKEEAESVQEQRDSNAIRDLADRRTELRDGEPCPLCGSADHPWHKSAPAVVRKLATLDTRLAKIREQQTATERRKTAAESQIGEAAQRTKEAERRQRTASDRLTAVRLAWQKDRNENGTIPAEPDAPDVDKTLSSLAREVVSEIKRLDKQTTVLDRLEQEVREQRTRLERCRSKVDESRRVLHEAILEVERGLRRAIDEANTSLNDASRQAAEANAQVAAASARREAARSRVSECEAIQKQRDAQVRSEIATIGLSLQAVQTRLAHAPKWVAESRARLLRLDRAYNEATVRLDERQRRLRDHEEHERPGQTEEDVRTEATKLELDLAAAQESVVQARASLNEDDRNRAQSEDLRQQIEKQRPTSDRWAVLSGLIGSADGSAFRRFAQSLTLDTLLVQANEHLLALAPRYRLARVPGEEMDLQVVDLELGDDVRTINSLSGGESFLASLALALGLSSLSSHGTRIESLFIDEGFGFLDQRTLEIALATLDNLQASGRKVGLVSHVPGLAARVGVQIHVRPLNVGRSRVEVGIA